MRWSQGVWSEQRVVEAFNASAEYWAVPFGPSGAAPDKPDEAQQYFERLEAATTPGHKRPDLLIFPRRNQLRVEAIVDSLGGAGELQYAPDHLIAPLLACAVAAIECENSLWKSERMKDFGQQLRLQPRTRRLGLPKSAVVPTVIIKQEDLAPLVAWQSATSVPVHVWQVFFDRAWGIALADAVQLIERGDVPPTSQDFHAPSGATTHKVIFKIWYQLAYDVGTSASEPRLMADYIEEKNGKILPFVRFEGGHLHLSDGVFDRLASPDEKRQ